MRATEYVQAFEAFDQDEAELLVIPALVDEMNNMIHVRRAVQDHSIYSVFKEFEDKYKLIAERLRLDRNCFRDVLFEIDSEIRDIVRFCGGGGW